MRSNYSTLFGKYDRPFTAYLFEVVLGNGVACDEESSHPDAGGFVGRIGKRVLIEDSLGFCYSERYETIAMAQMAYAEISIDVVGWDPDEDLIDSELSITGRED